ncbi:Uncharacterised protein [Proteus vulgaris]|nr:hypothetical protein BN1805_02725 [Proteus vulgaris]SUC19565.1 Uncharacterised protein [Proteus vulgaris]
MLGLPTQGISIIAEQQQKMMPILLFKVRN